MNQINAAIKSIITEDNVSLVVAQGAGIEFFSLVIDNTDTADYLQEGKPVEIVFKESAVSIAKNATGLFSIRNRISCTISGIQTGNVLTTVSLDCKGHLFKSVITTNAAKELDLQTGESVEALIKTTDISLLQPES